jgi:sugar/nucleoside kinase (ribokinase family)
MIAVRPDLLIIGGLAVDRLADGSSVAGGSVMHGATAMAWSGRQVATITAAGPEPEAAVALAALAALGPSRVAEGEASIRYAIDELDGQRRLTYEGAGSPVSVSAREVIAIDPLAVLIAPIAAEIAPDLIRACAGVPKRVAALQGWLRELIVGEPVRALLLSALDDDLAVALAGLDALVASNEDLAAVATEPRWQLDALRERVGPHPFLVITAGEAGAWLDDPASGRHQLHVPRRFGGASPVGAGDAFAAFLAASLGGGMAPLAATRAAMGETVDFLAARAG